MQGRDGTFFPLILIHTRYQLPQEKRLAEYSSSNTESGEFLAAMFWERKVISVAVTVVVRCVLALSEVRS